MFQIIFLEDLFFLVVENVLACFTDEVRYALHVAKRGCITHLSMRSIDEVRKSVFGNFQVETTWEEDVC